MPVKPCAHPGCSVLVGIGQTYCPRHQAVDKAERDRPADAKRANRPSRRWYKRKAWTHGRRLPQLEREPLCALCPPGSKRQATVADHVIPHRDDHGLFWFGELQSLCKSCHDSKKQRMEKRGARRGYKSSNPTDAGPA